MTPRADTEKRQATVADLAAVLTARLPDADLEALTDQGAVLHLTTPQARTVLHHLRAHPDALTSGGSEGPAGLFRLLDTLAGRYPSVHRMRYARCADVRALPHRHGTTRICNRCYARTHLIVCVRCGRQGHAAVRDPAAGGTVCDRCNRADPTRHEPCIRCGRNAPVAYRIDGAPFCQNCGPRKRRTCGGCGRTHARTHQIVQAVTDDGPLCPRCYRRGRVPDCGAALAALAGDLPAPVLADLLGISVSAATRWSALAARDYTDYLAARTAHPSH